MSIWLPKRGKNGKWQLYSIGIPFQLLIGIVVLIAMLLLALLSRIF